jgi:hypothetical protein
MTQRARLDHVFAAPAAAGVRASAQAWLWWRSDETAAARLMRW